MESGGQAAHMHRALELARSGWGLVHPNPLVGAVVVRDGRVVGEGFHAEYGGAHAEVVALRAAGEAARGATLYVTLEPCAHHGHTPPCTQAIRDAGIAHVIYAADDPNPQAAGGAAELRRAGLHVEGGLERDAARTRNAAFFHVHEHGAPFVALKLAVSLDGRIAARPGHRTTLSSPAGLRAVHRLRAGFDAILIGRATAAVDDPLLTVRGTPCRTPPIRIVADTHLRLTPDSRLARTTAEAPLWILAAEPAGNADDWAGRRQALEAAGARVLVTPAGPAGIHPGEALRILADAGVRTVLVEGGARIAGALLGAGLVHRFHLLLAPVVIGRDGVPAVDLASPPRTAWRFVEQEAVGADLMLTLDAQEGG